MVTSVKQMVDAANMAVPRIGVIEARALIAKGALVIDVRDGPEVEKSGKVLGAVHIPRGMLEFRADPQSPQHDRKFDYSRAIIVYCGAGGRSALAGKTLKDLGYDQVFNLGPFADWAENGGEIEPPIEPGM